MKPKALRLAPPLVCADLPAIGGVPGERTCEEILQRQPGGHGTYWWVKVKRHALSTTQARQAVARAANCSEDEVGSAGARDRSASVVQWFSVPIARCDQPGPLRNAGFQGKLKTIAVEQAATAISEATSTRLRWTVRIPGGGADDGYRRAKAVMDRLRRHGLPNLPPAADPDHAAFGLMLLQGRRLPARVAASGVEGHRCRRALQASLFTAWVAARVQSGAFLSAITGDLVRQPDDSLIVIERPDPIQPRLDAFAATILGPWFGHGLAPAQGDAQALELAVLAAAGMTPELAAQLSSGHRRAMRVQPTSVNVELDRADIALAMELPDETALDAVLSEVLGGRA